MPGDERETYDVPTFAKKIGVSRGFAYSEIARTGGLAGIPVIRIGSRLVFPRAVVDLLLAGEFLDPRPHPFTDSARAEPRPPRRREG